MKTALATLAISTKSRIHSQTAEFKPHGDTVQIVTRTRDEYSGGVPGIVNVTLSIVAARNEYRRLLSGEIVGGVRLRIPNPAPLRKPTPAAAGPAPATRPAAAPPRTAPATIAAPKPSPVPSPLENHLLALDGMKNARTLAKLNEWAKWRKCIAGTTPTQDDDAEDCYHVNQERLTPALAAWPASFRRRQPDSA